MKKTNVVELNKTIQNLIFSEKESSIKFKYVLSKLLQVLKPEIEALGKLEEELNKILQPFQQDQLEIYKKYGQQLENGGYKLLPENIEIANKELISIHDKHEDLVTTYNKKLLEFSNLLQEESDLSVPSIDFDLLPNWAEGKDVEVLTRLNLIKENE
jgi:hypothetical protein